MYLLCASCAVRAKFIFPNVLNPTPQSRGLRPDLSIFFASPPNTHRDRDRLSTDKIVKLTPQAMDVHDFGIGPFLIPNNFEHGAAPQASSLEGLSELASYRSRSSHTGRGCFGEVSLLSQTYLKCHSNTHSSPTSLSITVPLPRHL
jgi:hypothetical protein